MAAEIVCETHSISVHNEPGIASGRLPGELAERGRALAAELGEHRRDDGLTRPSAPTCAVPYRPRRSPSPGRASRCLRTGGCANAATASSTAGRCASWSGCVPGTPTNRGPTARATGTWYGRWPTSSPTWPRPGTAGRCCSSPTPPTLGAAASAARRAAARAGRPAVPLAARLDVPPAGRLDEPVPGGLNGRLGPTPASHGVVEKHRVDHPEGRENPIEIKARVRHPRNPDGPGHRRELKLHETLTMVGRGPDPGDGRAAVDQPMTAVPSPRGASLQAPRMPATARPRTTGLALSITRAGTTGDRPCPPHRRRRPVPRR